VLYRRAAFENRQLTRTRTTENFPVGSWLIAAEHRPAVHAFYAFAREADDVADDPARDAAAKLAALDAFDAALLGGGGPASAVALRGIFDRRELSIDHPRHLLQAFKADASGRNCRTWSDLFAYCRYSAAPIGRFLLDLHGEAEETWLASDALCAALQILNHLQDAKTDWLDLRRRYIPGEWLERAGLTERELLADRLSPSLRAIYDRALDRVDQLNVQAGALPGAIRDRRMRMEAAAILALSERLAARLRRQDPLAARVAVTRMDKLGALWRAIRAGL
jgi:farnesyl-diphosphate farnesyltransferase